ncbi:MAG TPA: DNA alkylation repair protein [Enhygromyxa sp.]|nr:DNA alkylation repair protein [Enhygromyxa sp.]
MSATAVLDQLRALGTLQARQALAKHGAPERMFGVRFADLDKLARRHRGDHPLACELWASENVDARILAVKIADPSQMSAADLDRWLADLRWYMGVDVLVGSLVVRTEHAQRKANVWRKARGELEGRAGWTIVAHLARDPAIPDEWLAGCLAEIVKGIHAAPNRKREAMNSALIAIGGYREGLRERALAAADAIGKVEIDHGDTYCKTPEARPYIEAMAARARQTGKTSSKKSGKQSGKKSSK